jgi:hypothetical protein
MNETMDDFWEVDLTYINWLLERCLILISDTPVHVVHKWFPTSFGHVYLCSDLTSLSKRSSEGAGKTGATTRGPVTV